MQQIACEVINVIQVKSSSKNCSNAENLNEVQSSVLTKIVVSKFLENWQSVIKTFHVDKVMYQNV